MKPSFISIRFNLGTFVFLAACAALSLIPCAVANAAKGSKEMAAATLVEAADYLPCGEACSGLGGPVSAFCFRIGDQVLVAEGRSFLRGEKFSALADLAGRQLPLRFSRGSLWVRTPDGSVLRLIRGSRYKDFKDSGCIRAVHEPIVAAANAEKRPAQVPAGAFPLASSGYDDHFLWYECALDADKTEIACQTWYANGDAHGRDFFCARTIADEPVGAVATLDPLLSQTGRLVLKSGAVVRHDNRSRTNDVLDRPSEACR
jgi:hypothetical protein